MKIVCVKEETTEHRVALVPKIVKKFKELGFEVEIENNLAEFINISDEEFLNAGAKIKSSKDLLSSADIILKVNKPTTAEIKQAKEKALFINFLDPFLEKTTIDKLLEKNLSSISMNLIIRSTLAQKMDALSSQANLLGYAALIYAANHLKKILPMMTTPAGTISPAKVFVIGAGVAGLQAIATARRLGANVEAFDTRKEVEEQIKSLGAKFLKIDLGETYSTKQGYAKELAESQLEIQRDAIKKEIASSDIVITTAQIFGKKAPIIITKDMLKDINKSLIIIDLAIQTGGNVENAIADKVSQINNIKIMAPTDLMNHVAFDASILYSSNLYNLIEHFFDKEKKVLNFDFTDEIIKNSMLTHEKKLISPLINKGI
jgi:H+-translocating NAD(P) transhydrogenase subunit alpha